MCDACGEAPLAAISSSKKRLALRDLNDGWHCSIIGTCLTLQDLRALGRKLRLGLKEGFPADYQLHGFFVKEASTDSRAGKLLNKLIDKRHATAIKKARPLTTVDELTAHWEAALEAGDIPGPYWAILSHPASPERLCERMFADVHMLSHLVGASNRADIRRLQQLEEEADELRIQLQKQAERAHRSLAEKEAELRDALSAHAAETTFISTPAGAANDTSVSEAQAEADWLSRQADADKKELARQAAQIEEMQHLIATLKAENDFLEREIGGDGADDLGGNCGPCPFNLGGCTLLYVGGRHATVKRLRELVRAWNGDLLHHDGGREQSQKELAGAIARADAVLFPTDCISHSAMWQIKKLCTQSQKPFVPLRTQGAGALIAGLQSDLGPLALQNKK